MDLEQDVTCNLEFKKGSSLDVIRGELISIDVKNDRKQHRRQARTAQLNKHTSDRYDSSESIECDKQRFYSRGRQSNNRSFSHSPTRSQYPHTHSRSPSPFQSRSRDSSKQAYRYKRYYDRLES